MEPGGLCNARAMSLMDSPAFHRSHNSFLPAADNPPGRPSLATPAPPIRTTPKTLPCCTDRLNPPALSFRAGSHRNESTLGLVCAWSSGLCPVSGARADQHDYRCVPANQRVVAVVWRMFIDRSVGIKRCLALL